MAETNKKIRYVDSQGNIRESERPLIKPLTINGEEGFGVYHSPITVTPTSVKILDIKPRFFSEEVADQRTANEVRRKQADEKVKQMLSGKEYAKLGGLTLAGAAAAGAGAYALPALASYVAPGTVGGNLVGDMAGGLALGTAMEEGQRAAFGQSAGDILYKQVKPYLGDSALGEFTANMVRPEYWVSPSMLFKGTYNAAQNTLGKQFEKNISIPRVEKSLKEVSVPTQAFIDRFKKIHEIARSNPDVFEVETPYYMPNSKIAKIAQSSNFTPLYYGNIGKFNIKFNKEILDRLQEMGIDIDSPIPVYPNHETGTIITTPRKFMQDSPNSVYWGIYKDGNYGGEYSPVNGIAIVDPTKMHGPNVAMHEVIGHRRFPLIEALKGEGALEPYSKVLASLNSKVRNITSGPIALNELRATLLETQRRIMYKIYLENNMPLDLATIRGAYRKAVDDLSDEELRDMIYRINGYGQKYVKFATDKTWKAVRDALKYAPIAIPGVAAVNKE